MWEQANGTNFYGVNLIILILIVFVNNFEPNPILVNVNKLKPYKYVDQTLKGIQSSTNILVFTVHRFRPHVIFF
jgi:hypothetical protein